MQINHLYEKHEALGEDCAVVTRWGYCREQNAVRLGYCANILVALVGLILTAYMSKWGLWICTLVGASFGCAYFAEQLQSSPLRSFIMWASIAFTFSAYMVPLALALGG